MGFDLPRDRVVAVGDIDVRLESGPHPYEIEHAVAIETNWRAETARNPAFYDGRMVLLSALSLEGERLVGRCHEIRYATFLHWRKNGATAEAEHAFAHAVLVSSDNALVAIRMGEHTAGPGKVYFAAGSFEPIDFPGGKVDLHLNMAREVREETGLDIDRLERDPTHHMVSLATGTVIFRCYFLDQTADEAATAIDHFVAGEAEPEIQGPVVIRDAHDEPPGLAAYMRHLIDWHFSKSAG